MISGHEGCSGAIPLGMWLDGGGERPNGAEFEVEVTSQSVNVRLNASRKSPRGRFYWAAFFVVLWIAALCLLMFSNGKHGDPGMWHDFATNTVFSSGFIVPLLILLGCSALVTLLSWRYVVMAYPSDETFSCDRSTLTISKVRWLDIHNKDWRTRSYPLREIAAMKYRSVATAKGGAVYGLRFEAAGRSERVLPGLGTHDARKILEAVKSFGVNVSD
jgi:hypothetical protein